MKRTLLLLCLAAIGCGPPPVDPCKGKKAGDLVITELMIDPAGTDTGNEWFEIFNALGTPIDLKGLTLFKSETSGTLKTHTIRAGTIPARSYFVVGDVRSGANPAWINYAYGADLTSLSSTAGSVGIRCGTAVVFDEFTYTSAAKAGRSKQLAGGTDPDATMNDEVNWCDTPANLEYVMGNAGTPGLPNVVCAPEAGGSTCLSQGTPRPIVRPQTGQVIITEVMSSPSASDTTAEWFEVQATAPVDLNGMVVGTGSSSSTSKIDAQECLHVNAGEYALFARSNDPIANGGLPTVLGTFGVSLTSTNTRLTVSLPDAGLLDVANYASSVNSKAWQLAPEHLSAVDNDDPANFCLASVRFAPDGGGDFGSPGVANPACGSAPTDAGVDAGIGAGMCFDTTSMATRPIVRPTAGALVITELMYDPSAVSDSVGEWIEVLANSAFDLNGLQVGNEASLSTAVTSTNCVPVAAGSYVLFAKSADTATNGGLPPVAATFGFDLANTSTNQRAVRVVLSGTELDRMNYTPTGSGSGKSIQLAQGLTTPSDNDVAANVCTPVALTTYGAGDKGTPGAANLTCP